MNYLSPLDMILAKAEGVLMNQYKQKFSEKTKIDYKHPVDDYFDLHGDPVLLDLQGETLGFWLGRPEEIETHRLEIDSTSQMPGAVHYTINFYLIYDKTKFENYWEKEDRHFKKGKSLIDQLTERMDLIDERVANLSNLAKTLIDQRNQLAKK